MTQDALSSATNTDTVSQIRQTEADICHQYAWRLATSWVAGQRNGRRAVVIASRACELTQWNVVPYLETLAAAYAEANNFEAAVHWQTEAINKAQPNKPEHLMTRLAWYRDRRPCRDADVPDNWPVCWEQQK